MRQLIVLLGVMAVLNACTLFNGKDQGVKIDNTTSQDVMVDLWDRESSHLLDIAPVIPVDGSSFHRLKAGQRINISVEEISGYQSGKPMRLFLYRVAGDSACYQQHFDVRSDKSRLVISGGGEGYILQ